MRYNLLLASVLILASTLQNVTAQDTTKVQSPDPSYWEAGVGYLSNSIYLGRKDSLKTPYIIPAISYYNKSGFFITGSLSYLSSAGVSQIDLVELQGGYTLAIKKFSGEISATKDFYNMQSQNLKSETKGSVNATISYDLGFIKPGLQGGISFSSTNDYYTTFSLEHSFFFANDNFEMAPSFLLNASTQNYYSTYYNKRKYAKKNRNQTGAGTTITAYLPNASNFKVMDYEFELPLNYSAGKFIFNFTPTLAIPVNPNTITTTVTLPSGVSSIKTKTEKLSNVFFWTAGITYSF